MAKRILALNIGAASLFLAEYAEQGRGQLKLMKYGTARFEQPWEPETADSVVTQALHDLMREKGIRPGPVLLAIPGQLAFPRVAAIPSSAASDKFDQMVRLEIEQNVPFPIDEVICDSQVLGETSAGDTSVMILAAKTDQIEAITEAVRATGLEPELVDISPFALLNALRAQSSAADCSVILDVGAKTTSLVITEGEKLYSRSIPVAGNTLTREIMQAFGCDHDEAERMKCELAYVSEGGVTEDSDPTRDQLAKIARMVMTRLHAEISRSINFFRSQQGGSRPERLYLAGGTALLPQIDKFFQDSLGIEVTFLNPFETITADSSLDEEALATDAVYLGSTTGLALRKSGDVAIAIDLMPPSLVFARKEKARIPYLLAGAALFIVALSFVYAMFSYSEQKTDALFQRLNGRVSSVRSVEQRVTANQKKVEQEQALSDSLVQLMDRRSAALRRLNEVRHALSKGLWIEKWSESQGVLTVTVRGWKDATESPTQGQPIAARVESRLSRSDLFGKGSVKVLGTQVLGRGDKLEQFAVEMKIQ